MDIGCFQCTLRKPSHYIMWIVSIMVNMDLLALRMNLLHKAFKLCTMPKQKHIAFAAFDNDMHEIHDVHDTPST